MYLATEGVYLRLLSAWVLVPHHPVATSVPDRFVVRYRVHVGLIWNASFFLMSFEIIESFFCIIFYVFLGNFLCIPGFYYLVRGDGLVYQDNVPTTKENHNCVYFSFMG